MICLIAWKEEFFLDKKLDRKFFAPGRVNLIGEHTDYNGGHVFPCAINFGNYGVARIRDDHTIRLLSGNVSPACELNLDVIRPTQNWSDYPKGVINEFIKLGHSLSGFDFYIWGDIPNSAGLSSSASIELLTAVALNSLFDCGLTMKEMVLLCQRAENQFVGVNCGIMDQYAVGMGKKDHALLLNCNEMQHEYVPLNLDGYALVIANTNMKRGLADSKYNERRAECDKALRILQEVCDVKSLCEIDIETFEKYRHKLTDSVIEKRAAHAIYENARTIEAVRVLNAGDIQHFGNMMRDSHISLRDLYEVTGEELDALAESAWETKGVISSRMTGAGFGGCTVSIVKEDCVDDFIQNVGESYTRRTGLKADFYKTSTGSGACEITK